MTLREFIEHVSAKVGDYFDENGEMCHVLHFVDSEDHEMAIGVPYCGGDKDAAAHEMREILRVAGAKRCLLVNECWKLSVENVTNDELEAFAAMHGTIKDHPSRVETVMLCGEDADEGTLMAERRIVRKINSRPRLGSLIFLPVEIEDKGRLAGLLPRRILSS